MEIGAAGIARCDASKITLPVEQDGRALGSVPVRAWASSS